MPRKSTLLTKHDAAGDYVIEIFDSPQPKGVVVCIHGRGVHREDGERFFYAVTEHYPNHIFVLVDQNQFDKDTCLLSPLPIALARVQGAMTTVQASYPDLPLSLIGHSMGCGLIAKLNLDTVSKAIFVAPTAGKETEKLASRYGADVANGKLTISSDGLKKYMSKGYFESMHGIVWEDEYRELLTRFSPIYVFESGEEEIVGKERLALRNMPFASYDIIPGATHNLHGDALQWFFKKLDALL